MRTPKEMTASTVKIKKSKKYLGEHGGGVRSRRVWGSPRWPPAPALATVPPWLLYYYSNITII